MKKTILILMLWICACTVLNAQDKGQLTGSLESLDHFYVKDEANESKYPDDRFATNNYLKLDFYKGKFSAGMQLEGYFPAVVGYPEELKKVALSNLYVNWKDERFDITAGTFYDQFGSGLLFRSWEDRQLGLNTAVAGARFAYNFKDMVNVRALWGVPRLGMKFTDTQVRGIDLSLSISNMAGWDKVMWNIEASGLNKYESLKSNPSLLDMGYKENTYGWSARTNLDVMGFYLKGEYVDAGNIALGGESKNSNAQLLELGYNDNGLGVTLTARRLERMNQPISVFSLSKVNMISYVPAMCAQHTYMLLTLNPYNCNVGSEANAGSGEIGGQLDAFYNFRRGTKMGGKRGMRMHANFSTYYTIAEEGTFKGGNHLYTDFTFDVSKQFTKKFKAIFMYNLMQQNLDHGFSDREQLSNTFIADLLYKYTPSISTRMELQYLQSAQADRDWMAILLEVNFAPHWSIWGSDMINHGTTNKNYYNAGVSFTKGRTRLALGYGRYRKGFICSGGVCREIPAYTGLNFSLTSSF